LNDLHDVPVDNLLSTPFLVKFYTFYVCAINLVQLLPAFVNKTQTPLRR